MFAELRRSPQLAALAAGSVLACLLAAGAVALWSDAELAERRLRSARAQMLQLHRERDTLLAMQAARVAQEAANNPEAAAGRPQGVLYSLLEQALTKAGLTPQVQYLRPDSKKEDELTVSESVSLALRQLDRRQLVTFLQVTEQGIPGVTLQSCSLTRTKEGFADVTAVFNSRTAK